nr:tetratricopeptide repeat protein [Planctomycetota bacterium]
MKSLFKRQLLPLRWWLLVGFCVMLTVAFGARPALYAYRLNRARRALENHRLDQAFDWLEAAGRRTPESSEVQFLLARAHRKLGRLKTARRHLESAWKLGYSKAAIEREQWMAKAQSGELSDVEPKLKAHLAQSGEDTQEICEALVNGYLRNYDFAAARNWVDAWQSDFPTAAQPHYCRGVIWRYLRWYAKATDEFTKALALDPERSDIRLELAKNLELQDSFDAALEHYRICCEQRADDPQAMSGLANCLSRLGEHSEAQTLYQRILDRWPEQVGARLGLAKLDLAAG